MYKVENKQWENILGTLGESNVVLGRILEILEYTIFYHGSAFLYTQLRDIVNYVCYLGMGGGGQQNTHTSLNIRIHKEMFHLKHLKKLFSFPFSWFHVKCTM